MHIFETILRDALLAGRVVAPVFIHSPRGIAILNATEDGLLAILEAHQQSEAHQQTQTAQTSQSTTTTTDGVKVIKTEVSLKP